MTEPKLLTEAEWRANLRVWVNIAATDAIILLMRERGMIAPEPEPVDPLLDEAREICAKSSEARKWYGEARGFRDGEYDDYYSMDIALTALRRNLELAERPTLTREMVREAYNSATEAWNTLDGAQLFIDLLHAALVERLK